ncbi:MAG TPA: DUF2075 domain-containing protein [Crocinitomix sp.]|nr:DUF2075 domain-containing protein [Crocinitomix sp.]
MTQDKAFTILKSGYNVFLTGQAGTGKTYLLNQFIKHLRKEKKRVAITASTGIAATHIKGTTIHSWSGIGIKQEITSKDINKLKRNEQFMDRIHQTDVLIIDEISMLHKDQLDSIHYILEACLGDPRPFGGLQVVLCGDFFQLPPVGKKNERSKDKFCFMSKSWQFADFKICYLTKQYRQTKNDLITILQEIRTQNVSSKSIELLNNAAKTQFKNKIEPTKLYTHNIDVDKINLERLSQLKTESYFYEAKTKGDKTIVNTLKKQVLAPNKIELKIGAKVMFVKNNTEKNIVNGTLGKVIDFSVKDYPIVKTTNGRTITVYREFWIIEDENGNEIASYNQLPLRLAWAITIHKSQGMTLDVVEMDLTKTFEPGQGYVALSRLKDIDNLLLKGYNEKSLEVDTLALKADKRFKELSESL